jgi:hypothetical protein
MVFFYSIDFLSVVPYPSVLSFNHCIAGDPEVQPSSIWRTVSCASALPPLPESIPPRSPPLPSSSQSSNMLVTTTILQDKVEGLTRNLTSEDVETRDAGVSVENVAAMRGGTPVVESAR